MRTCRESCLVVLSPSGFPQGFAWDFLAIFLEIFLEISLEIFLGISPEFPDLASTVSTAPAHFKGRIRALVGRLAVSWQSLGSLLPISCARLRKPVG
jgi:hypothetical protein